MEIMHRISFNSTKDTKLMSAITELNIDYKAIESPGGKSKLITIVIYESDPYWAEISKLIALEGAVNRIETLFTEEEIRNAEWVRLRSTFEQGYPQPKMNWPIKQLSYELFCQKCALHKQTHPMRLAKEPSLRRKSFFSTIWTAEVFCTQEVIQALEKIQAKGYEVWDVLIHKTSKPSDVVRQIYVPGIAAPGLIVEEELTGIICPVCGTTKYYSHAKGKMKLKRESLLPDSDFMLTHEWFGSGYFAWQELLVSNRIASLILDKGWQGVRFKVVELV